MHPNVYLQSFWQAEIRPQIFVAMSFDNRYKARFENIFTPAINSIQVNARPLRPYRVDTSKSGDSILTDIMDGIAHSEMVLADVSSAGRDSVTGQPYRNGNVLYEVGVALACRQPAEVLLVRDDEDKFLFDVSTIPHMKLDFANEADATAKLHAELLARLQERSHLHDARVALAVEALSGDEVTFLREYEKRGFDKAIGFKNDGSVNFLAMAAVPRLLDKQVIRVVGRFEEGHPAYRLTRIGMTVAQIAVNRLPPLVADSPHAPPGIT